MLGTLGAQLNLSAIVDGVLGNWNRHFRCNWCNFANLTILSFHNNAGAQVNDTAATTDSAVLLPVINGAVTAYWKQHIRFVRIQMNLDFASLVTLDPPGGTVLRVEFYIELPHGSPDMTNSLGSPYRLATYLGPDNIHTMPLDIFSRDILGVRGSSPRDLASFFFLQKITVGNALSQNSKFWVVIWQDRAPKILPRQFLISPPPQRQSQSSQNRQDHGRISEPSDDGIGRSGDVKTS